MGLQAVLRRFKKKPAQQLSALQKISLYFYQRPRKTALIALLVVLFGIASYTTLLKREGFPAIETPYAIGQGSYLVNDAAQVDKEVARPLSDYLLKQDGVKSVATSSFPVGYSVQIGFEEKVDSEKRAKQLQENIVDQKIIPKAAEIKLNPFKLGFTPRGDNLVISVYDKQNASSSVVLAEKAERISKLLSDADIDTVDKVSPISQYQTGENPFTGQEETKQNTYERYTIRKGDDTKSYDSVLVGLMATEGADKLKLYDHVDEKLRGIVDRKEFDGFTAVISASDKPNIDQQINELQTSLLEGLLAVLIIGSIVIAIRASIVTVISMVAVIATVNAFLYAIGFSLNTMTLFALILGLSLIVDDTIIMVEAIEAQRKKYKKGDDVVTVSVGKVGQAMIAATSTAALSFTPLLFVGGIIGSIITTIPITIISALFVSLVVALVLIPLLARYLLLSKGQMKKHERSESSVIEGKIAEFIARPMLAAKHSKLRLTGVGLVAIIVGFSFIGFGGYMMTQVKFNIFPSSKDANQLQITTTMPDGATLEESQKISKVVDAITARVIDRDLQSAGYFDQASSQSVVQQVHLVDYNSPERSRTSVQIVDDLTNRFKDYQGAKEIRVRQVDAGPPASSFSVRVSTEKDREKATLLAKDIQAYLKDATLTRVDGSEVKFKAVTVDNTKIYNRSDNEPYLAVTGMFKDSDTSTLVNLARTAVENKFDEDKLAEYGLGKDTLNFSFGQEDENQDSFATMIIAFPIVLGVIFILLALQFRSLLQPLLIFMAIPFSLFGISLGLYYSDNPFSFFAMMGFFALIGLSIKNTILLTDYANQARRAGAHPVDAVHEALAERFRPLVATSLTAIVSLIPLAISSPFWEGLSVVLICGLLSSTFLVITVFPYYYLGAEFLRLQFTRRVSRPLKHFIVKRLSA